MSKRNNLLLLTDIIEAINNIEEYLTNLNADDFYNDRKTKDAVVRNLEIIGEASKQVTDDFKLKYPTWSGERLQTCVTKLFMIIPD